MARSGTLRSRLARARDKLRRELTRRGVILPSAAMAAALGPRSASAFVSSHQRAITTRAAISFAAGRAAGEVTSTLAAALAKEVLGSMLLHNLKVIALTLLLFGAIATGAGLLSQSLAMKDEPKGPPVVKLDEPRRRPAPDRMLVTGRVLDPLGKPVPNAATVMAYARGSRSPGRDATHQFMFAAPLGQARSDGSGRFQLDVPRTSSARNDLFGAVALAPGYGVGWVDLDPDAEQPTADIILRPEQVIQGRLFDVQGQPARDVKVTVNLIYRAADGKSEGLGFLSNHGVDFLAWPRSATSDGDGRFTVRGVGRNLQAVLIVDDPRFARLRILVKTDNTSQVKQVTMALEPAKIIAGRVTYADTGKPVSHAPIHILSYKGSIGLYNEFETDAEGRFRANPLSADRYSVSVKPPEGQPYLNVEKGFSWTKGALEQSIDLALPRGVVIHGKVTEDGSGKPLAGARVSYTSRRRNDDQFGSASNSHSGTGTDGSFRLAVRPGPGYLVVQAPSDDYVLEEIGSRMVQEGQPGGRRFYANAFVASDMKPDSASLEFNVKLRRGVTVKGQVVGPDGKLVENASMISRVILAPYRGVYRTWHASYQGAVRNGHFELHGLDPNVEVPVFFLEPKNKLGAMVSLTGKSAAGGPITVRLEPCGMAKAWLVDQAEGKPVEGSIAPSSMIVMVVTPGLAAAQTQCALSPKANCLLAHQGPLADIDPTNYGKAPLSDTQGRIRVPPCTDPRCDLSHHRSHDLPGCGRSAGPGQGIYGQARREGRPGRYSDRETFSREVRYPIAKARGLDQSTSGVGFPTPSIPIAKASGLDQHSVLVSRRHPLKRNLPIVWFRNCLSLER